MLLVPVLPTPPIQTLLGINDIWQNLLLSFIGRYCVIIWDISDFYELNQTAQYNTFWWYFTIMLIDQPRYRPSSYSLEYSCPWSPICPITTQISPFVSELLNWMTLPPPVDVIGSYRPELFNTTPGNESQLVTHHNSSPLYCKRFYSQHEPSLKKSTKTPFHTFVIETFTNGSKLAEVVS